VGGLAEDIRVRFYRPTDRQQVCQFSCANKREKWTREAEEVIRSTPDLLDEQPELAEIVVAVDDEERIVGVVVFGIDPEFDRPTIFSLGVVADRRRQYVGWGLKQAALAEFVFASDEPTVVVSQVDVRNEAMLRFNEKLSAVRRPDPGARKMFLVSVSVETQEEPVADGTHPGNVISD
jgi:RimJ/RimL family protein N-acetyltransferase